MKIQKNDIINWAKAVLWDGGVIVDTETTGFKTDDPNHCLIELAIYNPELSICFNSLVRPPGAQTITPGAHNVHHITDVMLERAPTADMITPIVKDLLGGRDVVIFNAAFDIPFLFDAFGSIRFTPHCLMKMYAEFYGDPHYSQIKWQSLENACLQCGIPQVMPHTALGDAMSSYYLLRYLAEYHE